MAWIELHHELVEHRKMDRLVSETGLGRDAALGRLCMLWLWTITNRPDGDLSGLEPRRLGEICKCSTRQAGSFLEGLCRSGFVDREGGSLRVHDWEDYAGRLLELRRRDRDRKRETRKRQREDGACPADVDRTSAENPPLPNPTVPYPTQPNQTALLSGGGDVRAPAGEGACVGEGEADCHTGVATPVRNDRAEEPEGESLTEYLHERNLRPEAWLGATEELIRRSRESTKELFGFFASRPPTEADCARAFPLLTIDERGPDGVTRRSSQRREGLLRYAFEQAALNGRGGEWPYIEGVLQRLHQRGIRDLAAAEIYDWKRE